MWGNKNIETRLASVETLCRIILNNTQEIKMSTISAQQALTDLQNAVAAEQAADAAAVTAFQALQAELAGLQAGTVLTPAAIESLVSASNAASTALSAAIPAAAPAAPTS